ncbi:MAG: RNA polymerase sigma factor [Bacteroidales bacterium]
MISADVEVDTVDDDILDDDHVSCNCADVSNYYEFLSDDVIDALEQLKPIYKEALILQASGHKLNEIMEISYKNGNLKNKSIDTVKSRLFLARQQLQKIINEDGERRPECPKVH